MPDQLPQAGDFVLFRLVSFPARLIRLGQYLDGTPWHDDAYVHAAVYDGQGNVLEAQPSGARSTPLSAYSGVLRSWSGGVVQLTPEQRSAIVSAARGMLGADYSFLDYLAIAAHRFHLPVPGLRAYIGSTHHLICSQLVDLSYREAGVPLFPGRWPGYVTPADLAELLGITHDLQPGHGKHRSPGIAGRCRLA